MNENCGGNCDTCASKCEDKSNYPLREKQNELSDIKNVIAVISGKGGVGKSLITGLLSVETQRRNFKTAVIDADITGPSMPQSFGVHTRAEGNELGLFPVKTSTGISLMSLNLLIDNEKDPVLWRGPILAGAVKQFWTDVVWGDIDYMFVDMPPGTGDIPLTVFQSLPIKGIIVATSPQELVSLIVSKAVKMAEMMHIQVLGIIENFSYFVCPNCGKKHKIFGESHIEEIAKMHGIKNIGRIPFDASLAEACDKGLIERTHSVEISAFADKILS